MIKSLLAAVLVCLSSIAANAAILSYSYQGQTMTCPASNPGCFGGGIAFTGSLVIDESLLPGGGIGGATLLLREDGGVGNYTYQLTNSAGVFAGSYAPPGGAPLFFETGGIVDDIIQGSIFESSFSFTFSAAKQIVGWAGTCLCGGSNDLGTFTSGDGTADGAFAGPGAWTLAAVPLPAPLWLLIGGLAALRAPRALGRFRAV